MFILPSSLVKKILAGKVGYNNLPYNNDNEILKGYNFEDQARANLLLAGNHTPICRAIDKPCVKEGCPLFTDASGNIPNGWACREYQVDFPTASFDSRMHIALVGGDSVDIKATKERLEELMRNGAKYVCLGCKRVCAKKPERLYEDGHGGRFIEMCLCDSDLFDTIDSFIKNMG